jgi:hypothetical protein
VDDRACCFGDPDDEEMTVGTATPTELYEAGVTNWQMYQTWGIDVIRAAGGFTPALVLWNALKRGATAVQQTEKTSTALEMLTKTQAGKALSLGWEIPLPPTIAESIPASQAPTGAEAPSSASPAVLLAAGVGLWLLLKKRKR